MYVFNAGTITEVTLTRAYLLTYKRLNLGYEEAFFLNEPLRPFDIMGLVNDYIAQSYTSSHFYELFDDYPELNTPYGIKINEATTYYTVSLVDGPNGSTKRTIAQLTKGSLPASYSVYFLYYNVQNSAEQTPAIYLGLFTESDLFNNIEARVEDDGNFTMYRYISATPRDQHLNQMPYYEGGIPYPYNINAFYYDEDVYYYGPPHVIIPPIDTETGAQFFNAYGTSVADWVDAAGNEPYPEQPVPEVPFDPSEPDPYIPNQDDTSDLISIPGNPTIGVTSAGFINVYNPGLNALQGLGDILFPSIASATDIVDAVYKLCETIMNQNLINYVIDCHIIPVQPQVGSNANIKVGFRDTGISVPVVTNDYIDATCGSLTLPEYFGGFADYMTSCHIYLPFIGFVDTLPEYWQAGTISVDYKFNVIDGSFMAYIRSASSKSQLNGSVIAQFGGNACMHLPITGVNYANMVSGIIGGVVGMATGGTDSAVLGSAASAANTAIRGGSIAQSNGYNSTSALLGVRYPYLLIERPVPNYPTNYAHDKGYPSNISILLSNVSGFTTISDIDLSGIPFTSNELSELRILLTEGVYF